MCAKFFKDGRRVDPEPLKEMMVRVSGCAAGREGRKGRELGHDDGGVLADASAAAARCCCLHEMCPCRTPSAAARGRPHMQSAPMSRATSREGGAEQHPFVPWLGTNQLAAGVTSCSAPAQRSNSSRHPAVCVCLHAPPGPRHGRLDRSLCPPPCTAHLKIACHSSAHARTAAPPCVARTIAAAVGAHPWRPRPGWDRAQLHRGCFHSLTGPCSSRRSV